MKTPSTIFARAHEALESDDLEGLRAALDQAAAAGIEEDDARLGHLRFMATWLDESSEDDEIEQALGDASGLLEAALQLSEGADVARIVLDVTDALVQVGELDDAEHALRSLAEREDVSPDAHGAAIMIRAQILLDHHEDPDEALAVLDEAPAAIQHEPGYLSLRAATLFELGRDDEALELLHHALEHSDDVELHYQLGLALRDLGREDEALEHLFEVRRRDLASQEVNPREPVPDEEVEDLRRRVEDVLDTLPDHVMAKVASATIRVERWVSESAIRSGADPRAALSFAGELGDDEREGKVDGIIVYRDGIVAQINDDDEIVEVITLGLVEEFGRFFDLELIPGV